MNDKDAKPEHEEEKEEYKKECAKSLLLLRDYENITPLTVIASQGVFFQFNHADLINWMIVLGND